MWMSNSAFRLSLWEVEKTLVGCGTICGGRGSQGQDEEEDTISLRECACFPLQYRGLQGPLKGGTMFQFMPVPAPLQKVLSTQGKDQQDDFQASAVTSLYCHGLSQVCKVACVSGSSKFLAGNSFRWSGHGWCEASRMNRTL